jgi:iron complex outermembrane receptor protein
VGHHKNFSLGVSRPATLRQALYRRGLQLPQPESRHRAFNKTAGGAYIPTLGTEGVLTAYYGNPRQVFVTGTVKF